MNTDYLHAKFEESGRIYTDRIKRVSKIVGAALVLGVVVYSVILYATYIAEALESIV